MRDLFDLQEKNVSVASLEVSSASKLIFHRKVLCNGEREREREKIGRSKEMNRGFISIPFHRDCKYRLAEIKNFSRKTSEIKRCLLKNLFKSTNLLWYTESHR